MTTFKDYEKALEVIKDWEATKERVKQLRSQLPTPRMRLLLKQRDLMIELEFKRTCGGHFAHNWYIENLRRDIINFTRALRAHESKL